MIEIITDGAYSFSRNKGGSAFVVIKDDKCIYKWSKSWNGGTNNTAELLAIIAALKAISKPIDKVIIVSDSMYCVGCITLNWARKKNQNLWKYFDKIYDSAKKLCSDISFIHIRGHGKSNSKYSKWNDLVDKLAVYETQ